MALPSHMSHNFSQVPPPELPRSKFDRSSTHKTTFNSADLVPIFIDEILPGDTVSMVATFLARLSTFIFPIMDNIFFETFFFFVPARILWEHWEEFNGSSATAGAQGTDYLIPSLGIEDGFLNFNVGTLFDYMGLPVKVNIGATDYINALPFRAYNMIWNEWFRDQNLQDEVPVPTGDGPDLVDVEYNSGALLKRGKRHDYFTSCLPYPQKGDSIEVPIGSSAPVTVYGTGLALGLIGNGSSSGQLMLPPTVAQLGMNSDNTYTHNAGDASTGKTPAAAAKFIGVHNNPALSGLAGTADLSSATAATINQLRQAFAFQKVLERDARGGTRYVEYLKSHWGVTSPDFRLQRPEYLGGSSSRINVSQVPQTSGTPTSGTPQANLSAFVIGHTQCNFVKSFVEHGYILGLANVRSDITYQGGLRKLWSRQTRFDFPLPALMHLGEQSVLNKEIFYASTTPGTGQGPDDVFGYQERWAEYRYFPSMVTGDMRSNSAITSGTLDSWHLATDFGNPTTAHPPALNDTFIEDAPPIDRVIAVSEQDAMQVIMDSFFKMNHTRVMPTYSVPGFIDRF